LYDRRLPPYLIITPESAGIGYCGNMAEEYLLLQSVHIGIISKIHKKQKITKNDKKTES